MMNGGGHCKGMAVTNLCFFKGQMVNEMPDARVVHLRGTEGAKTEPCATLSVGLCLLKICIVTALWRLTPGSRCAILTL